MNALSQSFRSIARILSRISKPFQPRKQDRRKNGRGFLNTDGTRDLSRMTLKEVMAELQTAADDSREVFVEALRKLASTTESKDLDTRGHSERVTRFSVEIAKIMGFPEDEIERIRIGALIHDIGKITISEEILNKPTALTEAEYEVMKTHPTVGYELLKHIPQLKDILPGMQFHHEQFDGKGYPLGLKGDEIPMIARVITVADCFDAMITIRPYQDPAPIEYVLGMLRSAAGVKYDEKVVEALVYGVRTGRIVTRLEDRVQLKT